MIITMMIEWLGLKLAQAEMLVQINMQNLNDEQTQPSLMFFNKITYVSTQMLV